MKSRVDAAAARAGGPVARAAAFPRYVVRRVLADQVLLVAGDLGYISLIGLVPMLAIGFAILAAFPAMGDLRGRIEDLIFQNFVPSFGEQVQEAVARFVDASAELTIVGVLGLAVIALLLLTTVEHAFNHIFRVSRARSLVGRFVVYWTVMTLGPLLLGASFSLSSWLLSLDDRTVSDVVNFAGGPLSAIAPFLLTLMAFTLFYMVVPNRRVRFKDALVGAAVAAAMFAALRFGFVIYVAQAQNYFTLYGALAALPLFLTWLFASWTVVLLGAVITASRPEWRMQLAQVENDEPGIRRLIIAFDLLGRLVDDSAEGGSGLRRPELLNATGAPEAAFVHVLESLERGGILARTDRRRWIIARDLRHATLGDVARALGLGLPETLPPVVDRPWRGALSDTLERLHDAERPALETPLANILRSERPIAHVRPHRAS
ncbi:YihY family inner membrane protein [Caenispirillum salinarum]|uniref:YihY family inner membrane protein n=1 Tax=Caenispirillum salinarum TaxID=859058 RepID=UPI00384F8AD4